MDTSTKIIIIKHLVARSFRNFNGNWLFDCQLTLITYKPMSVCVTLNDSNMNNNFLIKIYIWMCKRLIFSTWSFNSFQFLYYFHFCFLFRFLFYCCSCCFCSNNICLLVLCTDGIEWIFVAWLCVWLIFFFYTLKYWYRK